MRRLIVITQQVDPAHPALAATVPKLAALARRLDELVVLADAAVPGVLPDNVRVQTFGAGRQLARGLRFESALARELARGRAPVLAHMVPLFALLATPLTRPLRVPLLLWYTQWHVSRTLRLAERCATTVLSVDARSFPFRSAKLVAVGHGIDVDAFVRPRGAAQPGLRAVALGRYSAVKGYPTLLRAVRLARDSGADVRLTVHGPTLTGGERHHLEELERLAGELDLRDHVELAGAVAAGTVPDVLAASDVLLSNTVPGAADKAVYEAGAAGVPVLASTPVYDAVLPERLRFPTDDAEALAARLVQLAELSAAERAALGAQLRGAVVRGHSVETWAERVLAAAGL